MSKRKPHNPRARYERTCKSLLKAHGVAVYNIDPAHRQGLVNLKTGLPMRAGRHVADALCDIAHPWVIYISALCQDQSGQRYYKSVEIAPAGIYRNEQLEDVLREHYVELLDGCNSAHVVASGWIANPYGESLSEAQAARIFENVGAWPTNETEKAA